MDMAKAPHVFSAINSAHTMNRAHDERTQLDFVMYLDRYTPGPLADEGRAKTALVVLNCPIDNEEYLRRLHAHAGFVLYADGGANRVHDCLRRSRPGEDPATFARSLGALQPNLIHGDLDSLRDDVRDAFEACGVSVTQDPDQYSTDFGKAIGKIKAAMPRVHDILVLGSLGGRVDQGIGLLHELLREQKHNNPGIRFWLFTEASVTMLISPGTTVVQTPLQSGLISRNVGILPLYGRSVLTLKGFEWDVEHWPSELGGQVSTSNHVFADEVEITTDTEVLFTIERVRHG
jgi:thiamine pyrophosphokinase